MSACAATTGQIAHAAPPPECVTLTHGATHETPQGVTYDAVQLHTPDGQSTLSARHLTLNGKPADSAATDDLASAASLLVLAAMTNTHTSGCSAWLSQQGQTAENALRAGKTLDLTWQGAAITHRTAKVALGSLRFQIQGGTSLASAALALSGISYHNVANQSLLPSNAQAHFTLPARELAGLMDAIGGRSTASPAVHTTLSAFTATQGDIRMEGHGSATLTGNVNTTSALGHLEITNLPELIQHAREEQQMKLAAGLALARLVSHREGERNTWDTTWESGVLTVNGFPLPLK
ncbi:hypothetical protein J2D75_02635 [Acetobacter suratthaniensis]|uniref:DUF2125 domain-containing protein n=1 Tax=Acetobacter suratthaniensis TaxID=1502841 RepID=A0ABS3LII8_9PROT|nr:hypothetical protein [Acetobacter suratthaniensis]